jgi:hypothetical protein
VDESLNESLPCWPAITILVTATERPLPVLDQQAQNQIANDFQGKLLMFRLQNGRKLSASSFDVPELSARSRDIAHSLGACVGEDQELRALITKLLREQQTQTQAGAESELNSALIEAMLGLCHQPEKQDLGVAEITAATNKILENRGELIQLKPRAVGGLLRDLRFATKRLGAERRGFTLLNSVRKRIHDLAIGHKLLQVSDQSVYCSVCEDMFSRREEMETKTT